jgi:hypothetical protein
MPLSGTTVSMAVATNLTGGLDLASQYSALSFIRGFPLDSGTGANQADKVWSDTRTITASGTDDIDLAGVLTDAFGAGLTFVKVKIIAVSAASGNTNNVVVGNAAATQFQGPFGAVTHTVAVAPGGLFLVARADAAGWPVGAGTSDLLRVTNGGAGTSVTYDIVIIGTSA